MLFGREWRQTMDRLERILMEAYATIWRHTLPSRLIKIHRTKQ